MPTMTEPGQVPDVVRKAMERKKSVVALPEPSERRRLREKFELTQQDVAAEFGVAISTVSAWESGKSNPRGARLTKYAELLASLSRLEQEGGKPDDD